jgi:hypothetical protein
MPTVELASRLIDLFGAALYFNVFVQALTLGMVAGFVIRQSSSDRRP